MIKAQKAHEEEHLGRILTVKQSKKVDKCCHHIGNAEGQWKINEATKVYL